jgi:hypothetical protein
MTKGIFMNIIFVVLKFEEITKFKDDLTSHLSKIILDILKLKEYGLNKIDIYV